MMESTESVGVLPLSDDRVLEKGLFTAPRSGGGGHPCAQNP